MNLKSKL